MIALYLVISSSSQFHWRLCYLILLLSFVFKCIWSACVCVRQLSGASFESLQPLRGTLVSCLHRRLSVSTHVVNTHLLHVLTHDHQLLDCLTTIRVSTSQFYYFVFHCTVCGRNVSNHRGDSVHNLWQRSTTNSILF